MQKLMISYPSSAVDQVDYKGSRYLEEFVKSINQITAVHLTSDRGQFSAECFGTCE